MKRTFFVGIFFTLFFLLSTSVFACSFTFTIVDSKGNKVENKKYKKGDVIILQIDYQNTHRRCDLPIEKTQFNGNGLKILSATKWTTSNNKSTKKLKLKITDNKKTASLVATRTCDRGKQMQTYTLKK
jgi:hypothetical protein